jgi:hypothetical protein
MEGSGRGLIAGTLSVNFLRWTEESHEDLKNNLCLSRDSNWANLEPKQSPSRLSQLDRLLVCGYTRVSQEYATSIFRVNCISTAFI